MGVKIFALLLFSCSLFGQTAVFPGAVVTDAQLGVATNNIQTLLSGSINSTSTSFQVVSAAGMAANQIATIDSENVWICGVSGLTVQVGRSACPNVDGRGFDGSAAVSHSATGANCNFGTATGCVTEFVVGWHHNAPDKEIEAVEKHDFSEWVNAVDLGADVSGATDSTAALQAGVTAAAAVGKCFYIPGSSTAYSAAAPAGVTPFYKVTGTIYGAVAGGTCIRMDSSTTIQEQTLTVNVISLTGSFNWIEGGNITWAGSGATSGCGIYGADTSSLLYNDNTVLNTRVINNITTPAASGFCVVATHLGAYRSNFLNIQARGFQYGVTKTGVSSGIVANNGKITGEVDNNDYGVYLNYAGENEIDVVQNGNLTASIWMDNANRNRTFLAGGEASTKGLIYNSTAAQNNVAYADGVGTCSIYVTDNSNGLNQCVGDIQQSSISTWTNGDTRFCFGTCYTTNNFPAPNFPQGFFQIAVPLSPSSFTSNLLLIPQIAVPTARSADYFSFNPYNYNASTNPNGGHGLHVRLDNANTTGYVMEHDGGAGQAQALDNWLAIGTQFGVTGFVRTNSAADGRTGFSVQSINDAGSVVPTFNFDGDGGMQYLVPVATASLGGCSGTVNTYKSKVVSDSSVTTYNASISGGGSARVKAFCNGTAWVAQ